MTTPPKAPRFHTSSRHGTPARRPGSVKVRVQKKGTYSGETAKDGTVTGTPEGDAELRKRLMQPQETDDGFGDFSLIDKADNTSVTAPDPERNAKLDAIRAEGLSARQLRIARRIATLHNIDVKTDEEAVLELRERGIDPSHRATLGKILSNEGDKARSTPSPNAPALRTGSGALTGPDRARLPSSGMLSEDERAAEIQRIQRELVKRRRRRMLMLTLRLLVFVLIPTALTGWYYFRIASPLYATESQFQIQMADLPGESGSSSTPMAINTDAVAVQSYLTSRKAMSRLNDDLGFKKVFQDPDIDPVKRLPSDASNEDTYQVYKNSVKVSYDPTEGVVNMKIIAPSPELSGQFSEALLGYAEEQVDQLTARLREDQMKGARENYQTAEEKMSAAQRTVQDLQERLGVLDPQAEGSVIMQQVSAMESELITKQLELGHLLANSAPVQSRVSAVRGDIERLKTLITETRQELTQGNETRGSLARIGGQLRVAEGDLETRQSLLASAAEQLEAARIEANKQVRYLSLSVPPVPPDEATYPKSFQNTLVAFLIFSAIYLILSLTASILREQVST